MSPSAHQGERAIVDWRLLRRQSLPQVAMRSGKSRSYSRLTTA